MKKLAFSLLSTTPILLCFMLSLEAMDKDDNGWVVVSMSSAVPSKPSKKVSFSEEEGQTESEIIRMNAALDKDPESAYRLARAINDARAHYLEGILLLDGKAGEKYKESERVELAIAAFKRCIEFASDEKYKESIHGKNIEQAKVCLAKAEEKLKHLKTTVSIVISPSTGSFSSVTFTAVKSTSTSAWVTSSSSSASTTHSTTTSNGSSAASTSSALSSTVSSLSQDITLTTESTTAEETPYEKGLRFWNELGDSLGALFHLERSKDPQALLLKGDIYSHKANLPEAAKCYKKYMRENPQTLSEEKLEEIKKVLSLAKQMDKLGKMAP